VGKSIGDAELSHGWADSVLVGCDDPMRTTPSVTSGKSLTE